MNGLPMKPCPFCGEYPTMQPWHGGLPTKKLISCTNAGFCDEDGGCSVGPSVSGETEAEAVASWNRRASVSEDGEEKLTPEEAWTILCETPDITSPAEYPDHALITMEQLRNYMERAAPAQVQDEARCRDCDGYNCDDGCAYPDPATTQVQDVAGVETTTLFHIEWIAGARPPVHPHPMTGRTIFETFERAAQHMRSQADDAQFVSLQQRTITAVTVDRSADLRAMLAAPPVKCEIDLLEAHLKSLIVANPEKALLAALDDDTRMWFLAELLAVASGRVPLPEIEALVSWHLAASKGGTA